MNQYFTLLDDNYSDQKTAELFANPIRFLTAFTVDECAEVFNDIEKEKANGHYIVGYSSFELSSYFGYEVQDSLDPLMEFGVFEAPRKLTASEVDEFLSTDELTSSLTNINFDMNAQNYAHSIANIKDELTNGNSYQVNYTFHSRFNIQGATKNLYKLLRIAQPVRYGALINFPNRQVLSRSPELFFEKTGEKIRTRPMKGTAKRGASTLEDQDIIAHLRRDEKQIAENTIIVDLLRNDLGRIADIGSVKADPLYEVETYRTVHQMISEISAKIPKELSLEEIFKGLFPCGSITGAPKKRTMEIIAREEISPRGIYCGAIGKLTPENDMRFSVPIRTIVNDGKAARMGIGSGVTLDSASKLEYDECLVKGKFLFDFTPTFNLIETFKVIDKTTWQNWDLHFERLKKSANYFNYPIDRALIEQKLQNVVNAQNSFPQRARIEISERGEIFAESHKLTDVVSRKIILSEHSVTAQNIFHHHKTTRRALYNEEFNKARAKGFYDVIFLNEHQNVTECAIHNIFIKQDNEWVTPLLTEGVLPGIGRAIFIANNNVVERALKFSDLKSATEIKLVSSVRGSVNVTLA